VLDLGAKAGLRGGRTESAEASRSRSERGSTHHVEFGELADLLLARELFAQAVGCRVARRLLGESCPTLGFELVLVLRAGSRDRSALAVEARETETRREGSGRTSSTERVRAARARSSVRT